MLVGRPPDATRVFTTKEFRCLVSHPLRPTILNRQWRPRTKRSSASSLKHCAAAIDVALAELFAVDATWRCPPSMPWPDFYPNRDAIFDQYFAVDDDLFETGVSTYDLEILNTVAQRNQVAVEMCHRGVGLGGQTYTTDHCVVYVLRDGLITEAREYIDTLYLTRALIEAAPD